MSAPVPPETPPRRGFPRPLAYAALFLVALGLRGAVLSSEPEAGPREALALAVTDPESEIAAIHAGEPREAVAELLAAIRPWRAGSGIPDGLVQGLPPTLHPAIRLARILLAVLASFGAVALAWAATRTGGPLAGLLAGGLLALHPAAVEASTAAHGSAVLLAVAPFLLALLATGSAARAVGPAAVTGACLGIAGAAGGGGPGLWLGLPWAAAGRTGAKWLPPLALGIAAAATFVLAAGGTGSLPMTLGAAPLRADSPLGAAFGYLLRTVGWLPAALLLAGVWRILASPDPGGRAVLAATAGALLVAVVRDGADPVSLAVALPGLFLLAAHGLAALPSRGRGIIRAGATGLVLAFAGLGAADLARANWARTPQDAASEWIRRNFPADAAFLLEDPRVHVATPAGLETMRMLAAEDKVTGEQIEAYAEGTKTFFPIPLPPSDADPSEKTLFYDPNLTLFVPRLVLQDPPPHDDDDPAALVETRRLYHEYFRDVWTEVASFPPGRARRPGIVILERPPEFKELDRERLGTLAPLLDSESMRAVRETSDLLTAWLRDGGGALRASGELIGARAFLEFATERDSTDVEALVQLSLVHIERERLAPAKEALLRGLDIDPFHGGVHYNLAVVLEAEGDLAGAETEYRAAIQYLPDGSAARARLGALLHARGDYAGARLELEALRATSPGSESTAFLEGLLRSS